MHTYCFLRCRQCIENEILDKHKKLRISGGTAHPADPIGRTAHPAEPIGRTAHPPQNVSNFVIHAPPKPGLASCNEFR